MNNTIPYWLAAFWLMLSATTASAQDVPPVLSSPPVAPAPTSLPATASPAGDYLLGRSYRVETVQGTTFTGVLVSMSLTALEFDAKELGRITLQRSQIRRADLQGPAAPGIASAKPGYFDIGNGNRIFFAPTGRGLRKGEGSLQVVDLFLVGANYGLNDYLSVGGYVTLIPGLGASQLLLLTPKVSLPVNERLALGAGVLYLRIPNFDSGYNTYNKSGYNAGVFYGAATYGSADNNFTLGVGYGFFEGEVGKTPVFQIGGQTRISRRVSLMSENYLVNGAGLAGLAGVKINWRQTSLGIASGYALNFTAANDTADGSIIPIYYDFTYRFGKKGK